MSGVKRWEILEDEMGYDTAVTDPHTGGKITFEMWVSELEGVMRDWEKSWGNLPYVLPLAVSTGFDCWRDSYDDGMSPQHAFWSDQEYWED